MKVVILCGGLGTRLREETEFRPKPMLEIGGRPILWHIMKIYAHYGYRDFVLCLGYKGYMIKEYFLNYEAMNNDFTVRLGDQSQISYHGQHTEQDFRVTLADTGLDCMTGGRVRKVGNTSTAILSCSPMAMAYRMWIFPSCSLSIAPTGSWPPSLPWLPCRASASSKPTAPRSSGSPKSPRPTPGSAPAISSSTARFSTTWEATTAFSSGNPWSAWPREGQLMTYPHEGFFYAMDTYREYQYLNEIWSRNAAPWKVWE